MDFRKSLSLFEISLSLSSFSLSLFLKLSALNSMNVQVVVVVYIYRRLYIILFSSSSLSSSSSCTISFSLSLSTRKERHDERENDHQIIVTHTHQNVLQNFPISPTHLLTKNTSKEKNKYYCTQERFTNTKEKYFFQHFFKTQSRSHTRKMRTTIFVKITHAITLETRRYAIPIRGEIDLPTFLRTVPFGPYGRVFVEDEVEILSTSMLKEIIEDVGEDNVLRLTFLPYATRTTFLSDEPSFHFVKHVATILMASMMHIAIMIPIIQHFGWGGLAVLYSLIWSIYGIFKNRTTILLAIRRIGRYASKQLRRYVRYKREKICHTYKFLKRNRKRVIQVLLLVCLFALCACALTVVMNGRGRCAHHHHHGKEYRVHENKHRFAGNFLKGVRVKLKKTGEEGRITDVKGLRFSRNNQHVHMRNTKVRVQPVGKENAGSWVKWKSVIPQTPITCRHAHTPSFDCERYETCGYECSGDWCVHPIRDHVPCDARRCSWEVPFALPNLHTGRCADIVM